MNCNPTIVQKLLASYALIGASLVVALVYAITSMNTISKTADDIVQRDLSATAATIALQKDLIELQRSVGRYAISRQPAYRLLYEQEKNEFEQLLRLLHKEAENLDLSELEKTFDVLNKSSAILFKDDFHGTSDYKSAANAVEKALNDVQKRQRQHLEEKLNKSRSIKSKTISRTITLAFGGVSLAILVAGFVIYSLSSSIRKLQRATHRIAAGDFGYNPNIPSGDEIGSLANDFMQMASRLKELEESSLDASPLTRLPGNIAIERAINHRLKNGIPFAMCYLDLDNFKSYNDRYGYIKASELIKDAGHVIYEATRIMNDPESFVGHIGGDDFVVIVSADIAEQTCRNIIAAIDTMIMPYYSDEDRKLGYIEGEDRYGVFRRFPLVSISIAALICRYGDYNTAAEIATAAARVKELVKGESGSNFKIVNRDEYDEA